jgi:GntR family transcriptional regulator, trigonelline degradation regulator
LAKNSNSRHDNTNLLIKQSLAANLKEEIIRGHLTPGQRIIEGHWARHFGVAQSSVREAINLLIGEGFVTKMPGRSARVTSYSETDIAQIYELRGALEGLAARLIAQHQPDLKPLELVLKDMRQAALHGDVRKLVEADLRFHLTLCELSGNHLLYSQVRNLLVPLFAFVSMRAVQSSQTAEVWETDIDRHRRMIDLMREGDPCAAEFVVRAIMQPFATRAYAVWQKRDA